MYILRDLRILFLSFQPPCDILKNVSQDVFRTFREGMIK